MNCINCSKPITDHTLIIEPNPGETPVVPLPGDITFCAYCGTLYEFGATVKLRALSGEEEKQILSEDIELARICYLLRSAIKEKIDGN